MPTIDVSNFYSSPPPRPSVVPGGVVPPPSGGSGGGGMLQGVKNFWNKLPTWGKILVIIGAIVLIWFIWQGAGGLLGSSSSGSGGSGSGGSGGGGGGGGVGPPPPPPNGGSPPGGPGGTDQPAPSPGGDITHLQKPPVGGGGGGSTGPSIQPGGGPIGLSYGHTPYTSPTSTAPGANVVPTRGNSGIPGLTGYGAINPNVGNNQIPYGAPPQRTNPNTAPQIRPAGGSSGSRYALVQPVDPYGAGSLSMPAPHPQLRGMTGGGGSVGTTRGKIAVATLTHGGPTGTVRPYSPPVTHKSLPPDAHQAPNPYMSHKTYTTSPHIGTQGHPGVRGATR